MTLNKLILTTVCCAALTGCSLLWHSKKASEQAHKTTSGENYRAIVVIAGNDARYDLRMSAMVREQLTDAGVTALKRSGRWGTENDAVNDICPTGQAASVDGILFVYYNQLTLIDCRTHVRAFEVQGGDEAGLPGMTKRLLAYLQTKPVPKQGG
ncbi:MAG: hypothetical protein HY700_15490 [Gemmatimonadetes bacterium]|nr:hypothetical protein [Gemmatimonadota bacterium]